MNPINQFIYSMWDKSKTENFWYNSKIKWNFDLEYFD